MKRLLTYGLMAILFSGICILELRVLSSRPNHAGQQRLSSAAALAGEFRTVAANLLWIKADRYHHEFVQRNADWTKDADLLGLLIMITDLDPRFVEAYSSGAIIYAKGCGRPRRAIEYLTEGISNNPRSWDLHRMAAIIYARRLQDPARALEHAHLAVRYCDDQEMKPVLSRLVHTLEEQVGERGSR